MSGETLITQGGFFKLLRGLRYRIIKPTRSFFSPIKGIAPGTVVTLTGDIRIEISLALRYGRFFPSVSTKIGVQWGRNLKGTDWITAVRFQRNTDLIPDSLGADPPAWPKPLRRGEGPPRPSKPPRN